MTSLQQKMKEHQNAINEIKEEIDKTNRDLTKLKNDNSLRQEKIEWTNDKIKKLEREIKVLRNNDPTMSVMRGTILSTQQQEKLALLNKDDEKDKIKNKVTSEISEMQMLEYYNTYLDNTNKQLDKYSGFKKKEEQNAYINPYPTINMKHTLDDLGFSQSSAFRLDSETDFRMLKELAFHYWNLDAHLVDENVNEKEALESLELTDENNAHIELKEKVIDFFLNRGQQNFQQSTILLQKKRVNRSSINNLQVESVKIQGGNKNSQGSSLLSFIVRKARIKKVETYKVFFQKFPGLKYYISELQIARDSQDKKKKVVEEEFELDDMNCLIISVLAVILALTLVSYGQFISTTQLFYSFQFMQNLLDIRTGETYESIRSLPQIYNFLEIQIGRTVFNFDNGENPVRANFEVQGSVQLRIVRTPIFNCTQYVNDLQKQSCFTSHFTQSDQITDDFHEWKYQTPEELGIKQFMKGNITTFQVGGYVEEFNRDITLETFKERLNYLKLQHFLDETTALVFIAFTMYSPSMNSWLSCNFLLERNSYNFISPFRAKLTAFQPNIYYGDEGIKRFQFDLVRLIFACVLLSFVAMRIYKIGKQSKKKAISYMFLEVGFFNIGVGIFTIISVILALEQSQIQRDHQELLNESKYVNLTLEAEQYVLAQMFVSLTIMFIFLRLSYILKLNERIAVIFQTYSKAFKELFAFLAIQFPLFLGFTIVFSILFGDTFSQYSTFAQAIGAQLALIQGQFNLEEFTNKTPLVSLLVILIFYFFMIFFIISLFQAILIECYRTVIMKQGYPQDKDFPPIKDLFMWFFSWIALLKSKKQPNQVQQPQQQLPEQQ